MYIHLFWLENGMGLSSASFHSSSIPCDFSYFSRIDKLFLTFSEEPRMVWDYVDGSKTFLVLPFEVKDCISDIINGKLLPIGRRLDYDPELN